MVADKGTEGVEGSALLPAVLIQAQVQKIFIGKDRKGELVPRVTSAFPV